VFFSNKSKRIDLCLTSEAHKAENGEYRVKNRSQAMFKNVERIIHSGPVGAFKKSMMLFPDLYKIDYQKFHDGKHDYSKK